MLQIILLDLLSWFSLLFISSEGGTDSASVPQHSELGMFFCSTDVRRNAQQLG